MYDQHLLWEELFEEQLNFFKRLSGSSIIIIYIFIIEHERLGKINNKDRKKHNEKAFRHKKHWYHHHLSCCGGVLWLLT